MSESINAAVEGYLRGIERLSAVPSVDPSRPVVDGGRPGHDSRLAALVGLRGGLLADLTDVELRAMILTVCGRAALVPVAGADPDAVVPGAMQQTEIAAQLGCSVSGLKRALRSARAKVTANLTGSGGSARNEPRATPRSRPTSRS